MIIIVIFYDALICKLIHLNIIMLNYWYYGKMLAFITAIGDIAI